MRRSKEHESNIERADAEIDREIHKQARIASIKSMGERNFAELDKEDGQSRSALRKKLSGGNKNRNIFDRAVVGLKTEGLIRIEPFTARKGNGCGWRIGGEQGE